MNCSDISLILDDRDTGMLNDGLRRAVYAHVAECRDCARDWKLHTRLANRKLPAFPTDLLEECTALAVAGPATNLPRTKWNRAVVGVAVLAVAAATLMIYRVAGSGSAAVMPAPEGSIGPQDRNVVAETPSRGKSKGLPQGGVKSLSTALDARDTFSVRLSTLPDDTLNAADRSDFNIFRAAAIDELRGTPGLTLVLAESSPSGEADFKITLSAVRRSNQLSARLDVGKSAPNSVVLPIRGAFGQNCEVPQCLDAASLGESMSRTAALLMMPADAAHRAALLKQLQDSSLAPQQRLEALRGLDLRNLGVHRAGLRADPSGDSLRDPAVIRAVIDLAFSAPNSDQRAEIWRAVRSIKNPALVEPLARAAQGDADKTVRAEAVATLVADYSRDPRSIAALELIARIDSHSMVRALAKRGLSGEATWNSYVSSSLEDKTLSDAQRLEALLYHARSSDVTEQPLADLLDEDAIEALAEVLPRAASTGSDRYGVQTLLMNLVSVKHPAITRMLLASIERRDPRFDRGLVTNMLADRMEEPDVRAALEKIAKADPDEQSRQVAREALKQDE